MTLGTAVTSIDGVSLSPGNRILYKDAGATERTGVYIYTDSTHLTRATDLNTGAAYSQGLRVHVLYGAANGGKNFYLTQGLVTTVYPNATLGSTAGDGTSAQFVFSPDGASNPNVALLMSGSGTIYISLFP